jgi:hypothetical protein
MGLDHEAAAPEIISFAVDLARQARLITHLNVLTSPQSLVSSPCGCSSATQPTARRPGGRLFFGGVVNE